MKHPPFSICHIRRNGFSLAFAFSLFLSYSTHAAERNWSNPLGGDFLTPGNWAENQAPASGDAVYFNAGAADPYTVLFHSDFDLGNVNSSPASRIFLYTGDQVALKLHDDDGSYALKAYAMDLYKGTLTFDGGAASFTQLLRIGNESYGEGALKLINGAVLTTTNTGDYFRVGHTGKGSLELDGASSATFSGRLQIGYRDGAGGSSVKLSNGSALVVSTGIYLGSSDSSLSGSDAPTGTSNNTLLISGGSSVTTTGNLYLGYFASSKTFRSDDNAVVVEGTGSKLTVNNFLRLGYAYGEGNTLTVKDGGELVAKNLFQVAAGNEVTIGQGGTAELTSTGGSNVMRGRLSVKGGVLTAGALNISGVVAFEGGTFELTSHLVTLADSRFEFTLDETLTIKVGGNLTVAADTYIDIAGFSGGAAPGDYKLFSYTGSATGLGNFKLGETFDGFEGNLFYESGDKHLYLKVIAIPEPAMAWLALLALPLVLKAWRRQAA